MGTRLKKYPNSDPGNAPDHGLERQYEGTDVGPTPHPSRPESIGGGEKYEATGFAAVRGGAGQTANTAHSGHGKGSGGPSFAAQKEARGHHEVNFAAVHGHGVAKRSAGRKTPPTTVDKGME